MRKRHTITFLLLLLAVFGCRKPFEPPVIKADYNYLVIDGVINANANGITSINLSRTKNLIDSLSPKPEMGAQVLIEAESGGSFALASMGNGTYNSSSLNLNALNKFRLKITTTNGNVYQSDFVPVKQTPPIDSITWRQKPDTPNKAVTIFTHTHDAQKKTLYYRWDYVETWIYQAPLNGSLGLNSQGLIFYTDAITQTYTCWGTTVSPNISTASSEALSQDVISYAPVNVVPQNDEKLAVRYSINVRQYALTNEAYNYWQIVKKSSQQTGSIFDPQPVQVVGNIHCLTNPGEPVIGFASASYITEKRIFIDNRELIDWHYINAPGNFCKTEAIAANPNNFQIFTYPDTTYGPYFFATGPTLIVAKKVCVDCRRRGGTNIKPPFWQ